MSMIVTNLKKEYKALFSRKVFAVNDISLKIERGNIYALVGQNGAGKTTAIKCILGLIMPSYGKIKFADKEISFLMEKGKVGYMPEVLAFPENLSLNKYLHELSILRKIRRPDFVTKLEYLSEMLNLKGKMNYSITNYSKGMKKKANFIQAVIHEPDFLVLDEPTDGLDPVSRRIVLNYIKKMSENGCTILITSHILADLEKISDKAGIMHDGFILDEIDVLEYISKNNQYSINLNMKNENKFENIFIDWHADCNSSVSNIENYTSMDILDIRHIDKDLEEWYFETLKKVGDKYVANY